MFESTVELLDRLCRKLETEQATGFNNQLAQEARKRLLQLDRLLKLVQQNEEASVNRRVQEAINRHIEHINSHGLDFEALPQPDDIRYTREEIDIFSSSSFDMELFTECFYYISHRLRTLLRTSKPIPGLGSFECAGARDVRNKLLEHVERKDSQVFIQGLGWGKENGPVLKAARWAGQEQVFPDKGLYVNAAEIKDNLEVILKRLLNEPV